MALFYPHYTDIHRGVSIVMVVPLDRWKVDFMENPTKMDEEKGYPHDFGNLHTMFWDQI